MLHILCRRMKSMVTAWILLIGTSICFIGTHYFIYRLAIEVKKFDLVSLLAMLEVNHTTITWPPLLYQAAPITDDSISSPLPTSFTQVWLFITIVSLSNFYEFLLLLILFDRSQFMVWVLIRLTIAIEVWILMSLLLLLDFAWIIFSINLLQFCSLLLMLPYWF